MSTHNINGFLYGYMSKVAEEPKDKQKSNNALGASLIGLGLLGSAGLASSSPKIIGSVVDPTISESAQKLHDFNQFDKEMNKVRSELFRDKDYWKGVKTPQGSPVASWREARDQLDNVFDRIGKGQDAVKYSALADRLGTSPRVAKIGARSIYALPLAASLGLAAWLSSRKKKNNDIKQG